MKFDEIKSINTFCVGCLCIIHSVKIESNTSNVCLWNDGISVLNVFEYNSEQPHMQLSNNSIIMPYFGFTNYY